MREGVGFLVLLLMPRNTNLARSPNVRGSQSPVLGLGMTATAP